MQACAGGQFCPVGLPGARRGDEGARVPLCVGSGWHGLLDLLCVLEPLGVGEPGSFLKASFFFFFF